MEAICCNLEENAVVLPISKIKIPDRYTNGVIIGQTNLFF